MAVGPGAASPAGLRAAPLSSSSTSRSEPRLRREDNWGGPEPSSPGDWSWDSHWDPGTPLHSTAHFPFLPCTMAPGSPPELILLVLSELTQPWRSAHQFTCWLWAGLSGWNTTSGAPGKPVLRPRLSHAVSSPPGPFVRLLSLLHQRVPLHAVQP